MSGRICEVFVGGYVWRDPMSQMAFSTNFEKWAQPGDHIAFYLLNNAVKVDALSYSKNGHGVLNVKGQTGHLKIKAFVKRKGEVVETAVSRPIHVTE